MRSPTRPSGSPPSRSSLFTDTIYVLTPQGKVVDLPRGRDAGRFRVRGAHGPRPSLPRRTRRRRDGAAPPCAQERRARRDHCGEAGRPVARLAQSGARLRRTATAPAPRSGSGSRRNSTRRRSPRAARSSSASSRARARPRSASTPWRRRRASREPTSSSRPSGATRSTRGRSVTAIKARRAARRAPGAGSAPEVVARQSKAAGAGSGILVVGVDRLLTGLARCCKPAPPDAHRGLRHARQGRDDPP